MSINTGLNLKTQARNQKFFRAGEISWNQGTLINLLLKKKQGKKALQGKTWELLFLDTLKNYTFKRKFNAKMDKIRTSFSKTRTLFSIFKIEQGKPPPPSP